MHTMSSLTQNFVTFQTKPNQIPPPGIRISPDLHADGVKKKSIITKTTIIATPPWLLNRPVVDLRQSSDKDITLPIFSRSVFMNCVAATVITIASTLMVLKLVSE